MNKHTGNHVIGMVLAGIMLLSVPAHSGETQSRTLRPDEPNPAPAVFGNVAPSDTVYFNVSVYTPEGYTLDKTEWSRTGNNPLFLWAGSGMSFSLVNTAWEPGTTTARVDAWWNGGEGGGGAGGGGSIHRYATGTASAEGATESELYVRVSPEVAPVGNGVSGSAFGKKIPSGEEFAVSANWSVSAPGYFKSGNQNVSSVSFSSDEPESVQVTAVNNGPPARQGSASAQFVKVVSISADPALVCAGTRPEFTVTTSPEGYQDEEGLVNIDFDENEPGVHQVVATCGTSSTEPCTVTVVKVKYVEDNVVRLIGDGGYDPWGNLTEDSFDPGGFAWSLSTIEGDETAWVNETTGIMYFGSGGGKYAVRATSASLETCFAEMTLAVVKTELKSLTFTSDHGVLNDNNADWEDDGDPYGQPEWVNGTSTNHPVSHTKNSNLTVNFGLKVEPSGMRFDLVGDGADEYFDFESTDNTSTGSDQMIAITAKSALPDEVCAVDGSIAWTISVEGLECSSASSGPHLVFVTWDTPFGSAVTHKRMEWACGIPEGSGNTLPGLALAMAHKVRGQTLFIVGRGTPSPIWTALLADAAHAVDCLRGSQVAEAALEILGVNAHTTKAYATSDTDASDCENERCGLLFEDFTLRFETSPGSYLNDHEGCFTVGVEGDLHFYTVWPVTGPAHVNYQYLRVLHNLKAYYAGHSGMAYAQWWTTHDRKKVTLCPAHSSEVPLPAIP